MKTTKILVATAACLCSMLFMPSLVQAQTGRVVRVNTVYDVTRDGQKGMLIQVDADVDQLQGQEVNFAAFFFFADGKRLPALAGAGKYASRDGQVTAQRREVPRYNLTRFTNVELFVPYFELTGGIMPLNLMFRVEIQYNDGVRNNLLGLSSDRQFTIR